MEKYILIKNFQKILPAIGGLVSGDRGAYEYLPASVLRFPAPELFIQMMKDAGFETVEHTPFTLGICRMYVGKKSALWSKAGLRP